MYDYTNLTSSYDTLETAGGIFAKIAAFGLILTIIAPILSAFMIICMWKVFKRAGKPGWASLVPIYNIVVLLQITNLPLWYLVLIIIPIANIYALFKISIELAHKFGKSTGFGVLIALLPIVGYPILAFSKNSNNSVQTLENNINNLEQSITPNDYQQSSLNPNPEEELVFNPIPNTELNNPSVTPEVPQMVTPSVTPEVVNTAPTMEPTETPLQVVPENNQTVPEVPEAVTPEVPQMIAPSATPEQNLNQQQPTNFPN